MSARKQAKRARFYARQKRLRGPFTLSKLRRFKRIMERNFGVARKSMVDLMAYGRSAVYIDEYGAMTNVHDDVVDAFHYALGAP